LHEDIDDDDGKVILEVIFLGILADSYQFFDNIAFILVFVVELMEAFEDLAIFWFKSLYKVIQSGYRVMGKDLVLAIFDEGLETFFLLVFLADLLEPLIK
jgi:hypothetical protein